MGQLVDVIPDGGQRPKQVGIGIGGTGPEIYAHNELPYQRLLFQPGHFCLSAQVRVLRGVQASVIVLYGFIGLFPLSDRQIVFLSHFAGLRNGVARFSL